MRNGLFLCLAVAFVMPAPAASPQEPDPAAIVDAMRKGTLDPTQAVTATNLVLRAGPARFFLSEGTLMPAQPIGGKVQELVFVGRGRITLVAPDAIEGGQLELFTGDRNLDEPFTSAVVAVASDQAVDVLLKRAKAVPEAAAVASAQELYRAWRDGTTRRLLGVEAALLADTLGDSGLSSYFVALLHGEKRGDFIYGVDPTEIEQLTVGQFAPLTMDEKQRAKTEKTLEREQRRGRLLGLAVDDLGSWNTWVSAAQLDRNGTPSPGFPSFKMVKHEISVRVPRKAEDITAVATLHFEASRGGQKVVPLWLASDAKVRAVKGADGAPLYYTRLGSGLTVVLADAPATGSPASITVEYGGRLLRKGPGSSWVLADLGTWYPRLALPDTGTYDVTVWWPRAFDLAAPGDEVARGEEGDLRWERRRLDAVSTGFSFQLGHFNEVRTEAGKVPVTLLFDREGWRMGEDVRDEVTAAIRDAVTYFSGSFGTFPFPRLTVVTAPLDLSYSLPGFITLGTPQLDEYGIWGLLLGLEDRRSVIAHEVAHQWWGNSVRWRTYRDKWLSEALATYASVLFARNKVDKKDRILVGATHGWEGVLTAETEDGRPLESLGPVVLGVRLYSDKSSEAHDAIVYKKGAVILDMLARNFGEELFVRLLEAAFFRSKGQEISTDELFAQLQEMSGQDLSGFTSQYVYGTGLPELHYSYEIRPKDSKSWTVSGKVRRQTPYRYRFSVVRTPAGQLDVARESIAQAEATRWFLVVPLQIAVYDPLAKGTDGRKSKKDVELERETGNAVVNGRLFLKSELDDFAIDVSLEPKELWLDRDGEVFCRFYNQQRHPKRTLLYTAFDQLAAGQRGEAEASLRAALTAAVAGGGRLQGLGEDDLRDEAQELDARVRLELARLRLDEGEIGKAEAEVVAAEQGLSGSARRALEGRLAVARSRLEVLKGDFEPVYKRLRKAILRRGDIDSTEAYLLLGIAAAATDHPEDLDAVLEAARKKGADVSLLEPKVAAPPAKS